MKANKGKVRIPRRPIVQNLTDEDFPASFKDFTSKTLRFFQRVKNKHLNHCAVVCLFDPACVSSNHASHAPINVLLVNGKENDISKETQQRFLDILRREILFALAASGHTDRSVLLQQWRKVRMQLHELQAREEQLLSDLLAEANTEAAAGTEANTGANTEAAATADTASASDTAATAASEADTAATATATATATVAPAVRLSKRKKGTVTQNIRQSKRNRGKTRGVYKV